jgi:hypothetical protein
MPHPDVLNFGWREYGNRVGVWRLLELFSEFNFPVSVVANSAVISHCPEVLEAFKARGDEVGFVWTCCNVIPIQIFNFPSFNPMYLNI